MRIELGIIDGKNKQVSEDIHWNNLRRKAGVLGGNKDFVFEKSDGEHKLM